MRNISKYEHCKERAAKCLSLATSMMFAGMLAPSKEDSDMCIRLLLRHIKHCKKYQNLARYYGGGR